LDVYKELLRLNERPVSLEWCKFAEDAHEGYSFQPLEYTSVVNTDLFEDEMDKFGIKQDIEAMLQLLSARERKVVILRYGLNDGDERTLEEVGKILNVTRERVRQIEDRAFKKIRSDYHLKKKLDKIQNTSPKTEENTSKVPFQHKPKQSKTTEDSKLLPKVSDVKSQKNIREVDGDIYERILSRNGFIWRRITNQEATGVKPNR